MAPSSPRTQSRRRRGRRPTRKPSPTPIPSLTKRKSLQTNAPLIVASRELAFRQLTEQLWAAGLPSSTTACSMSIRSRCSSAPPSERGGGGDETAKIEWDDDEENIEWDEPDIPDDGNGSIHKSSCLNFYYNIRRMHDVVKVIMLITLTRTHNTSKYMCTYASGFIP
jgi:hypothetical protein